MFVRDIVLFIVTIIFIHHTDITKNNPKKFFRTLAQGEIVQFDVLITVKIMS